MKEIDKTKTNNKQSNRSARTERTDRKQNQEKGSKNLNAKETGSKASIARRDSSNLVINPNVASEASEVDENTVIHYVEDVSRFEEVPQDIKSNATSGKVNKDELNDFSSDFEKHVKQGKEDQSDSETIEGSISSQEDASTVEDQKVENASGLLKSTTNRSSLEISSAESRARSDQETYKSQIKKVHNTPKKSMNSSGGASKATTKSFSDKNPNKMNVPSKPSSESSEGVDDRPAEEMKGIDLFDETSNGGQSVTSDNETFDTEQNGEHVDEATLNQKIEEMEMRIEKMEEELRDVAVLEISLYSVAPEHGSSAHKVHTPARRLSRLYIHASKHWTQNKRATIAKNTVSGLVLVAKSCGNDVSRLTFWLSNTVVLREIISQAFGDSWNPISVTRFTELNGATKRNEGKSMTLKWNGGSSGKQGHLQFQEDWQETGTFTTALERVESWIFSRIVESVWWLVKVSLAVGEVTI